jgi:hypothetical protein
MSSSLDSGLVTFGDYIPNTLPGGTMRSDACDLYQNKTDFEEYLMRNDGCWYRLRGDRITDIVPPADARAWLLTNGFK